MSGFRPGSVPQPRLLAWGQGRLNSAGKGGHEARLLLEWALGVDSLLQAPAEVGQRAAERYRSAIAQRCRSFPLQHITGRMHFRGLTLQAGPGVFAVRPETELLVELALSEVPPGSAVADLCAGSGAIGLSLAVEAPGIAVTAVELSAVAVAYARRNYDGYREKLAPGSSYEVVEGDATQALSGLEDSFSLVVTNPPYVPGQPPLAGEVLFDPEMALYGGGEDGLIVPRGIVRRSLDLLRPGGVLLMEHAESQGRALIDFALESGFSTAQTLPDLTGRPRFLRARKEKGNTTVDWDEAVSAIEDGHLIVVPTDTVYGIGCDPYRSSAVANLLGTKGRGKTMPPPVLAADPQQALALADWGRVPEDRRNALRQSAEQLAQAYWPGALTLIVPTSRPFGWDMETHGPTVAVRVPDEELTRELLGRTGPLAVTSANLTGRPPALTVDEAREYFGDGVAYYLDGGTAKVGEASTIIDCTADTPRVVRAGALNCDTMLRHYTGKKSD